MPKRRQVLDTVAHHAADADLALVEGVMGCFDGVDGTSEEGSTAQIAKWLGSPVVLVIDASSHSRSAAAVALGFERFDPGLRIGAVIANRVGGEVHARWVRDSIAANCRVVPIGAIVRDKTLTVPERHLDLVTAAEGPITPALRRRLAETIERSVDLDALIVIAVPLRDAGWRSVAELQRPRVRIAVARDTAFQFYYAENLDRLRAEGLYLGGGYPELHARALSANVAIREAVRAFADAGKPIYAECGGLMYLAEAIEDLEGVIHPMVGLLPTTVHMRPGRLTLDYTDMVFTADAPIGRAGSTARGHEFHYSSLDPVPDSVPRAYRVSRRRGGERAEGYLIGRALMSYVHLHFASNPDIARSLVDSCVGARRS